MGAYVIEWNSKWGQTKNDDIETTTKGKDYNKQCVNYYQSWHMGSTSNSIMAMTHSSR